MFLTLGNYENKIYIAQLNKHQQFEQSLYNRVINFVPSWFHMPRLFLHLSAVYIQWRAVRSARHHFCASRECTLIINIRCYPLPANVSANKLPRLLSLKATHMTLLIRHGLDASIVCVCESRKEFCIYPCAMTITNFEYVKLIIKLLFHNRNLIMMDSLLLEDIQRPSPITSNERREDSTWMGRETFLPIHVAS